MALEAQEFELLNYFYKFAPIDNYSAIEIDIASRHNKLLEQSNTAARCI